MIPHNSSHSARASDRSVGGRSSLADSHKHRPRAASSACQHAILLYIPTFLRLTACGWQGLSESPIYRVVSRKHSSAPANGRYRELPALYLLTPAGYSTVLSTHPASRPNRDGGLNTGSQNGGWKQNRQAPQLTLTRLHVVSTPSGTSRRGSSFPKPEGLGSGITPHPRFQNRDHVHTAYRFSGTCDYRAPEEQSTVQ